METKAKEKAYEKLSAYDKGIKNWEWTDLMLWIQDFKSFIEKGSFYSFGTPLVIEISHRLSLTLSPNLPDGVHFKTLELYTLLLKNKNKGHVTLLLIGLFSYFSGNSNIIKLKILDILIETCGDNKFYIESIIFALLKGTEEKGEIFDKVCGVINKIDREDFFRTSEALWRFMLKSKSSKLVGIFILKSRKFDKRLMSLALDAIFAGIYDENIRVKRHSLELVKILFPLNPEFFQYKIVILKTVFKVLDHRDSSLCRRLWEWVFPSDHSDERLSVSLLTQAFFQFISEKIEENFIIRTADLILQCETSEKIFEIICIKVLKVATLNSSVTQESFKLCQKMFKAHQQLLFVSLQLQFDEIFKESEDDFYKIIDFLLYHYVFTSIFCLDVFEFIMDKFSGITTKVKYLDLLIKLSKCLDHVPNCSSLIENLFLYVKDDEFKEYTNKVTQIIVILGEIGLKYHEILVDIKYKSSISKESDFFRIMSFIAEFKQPSVSDTEMQFIWKKLINYQEALNLILKLSQTKLEVVQSALIEILTSNPIGIDIFLTFWHKSKTEELCTIVNDEIICIIINQIETEQKLRPWIRSIENKAFVVVDFLIILLMDPITLRVSLDGVCKYNRVFNKATQISRLNTVITFLQNIDQIAVDSLFSLALSTKSAYFLNLHKLTAKNYIHALSKILVIYINTQPFDDLTITAINCLEALVPRLSGRLLYSVIKSLFHTLENAVSQYNHIIQIALLNIISPVLQPNPNINSYICSFLSDPKSISITTCVLQGCFSQDLSIRGLWRSTLLSLCNILFEYASEPTLISFISALLKGSQNHLLKCHDMSLIFIMKKILHTMLGINEDNCVYPKYVKDVGVKHLPVCIRIANDFFQVFHCYGQGFSMIREIEDIFGCIGQVCLGKLTESFFLVWKEFCQMKKKTHFLLKILVCFKVSLEEIVVKMQEFVQEWMSKNKFDVCVYVGFLLFKLLDKFEKIGIVVYKFEDLWVKTYSLIKQLFKCPCLEMPPILLKVMSVFQNNFVLFYENSSKNLKSEIKEIAGQIFAGIFNEILHQDRFILSIPLKGFESEPKIYELCINYMRNYAYDVAYFACIGELSTCSLYISNSCLNLLYSLPGGIYGRDIACNYIIHCLNLPDLKISEKIRKKVFEFIHSEGIFQDSSDYIHIFCEIIHTIVHQCYADKKTLITELINHYTSNWTFAKKKTENLKKSLVRMSLFIYCGNQNDYLSTFNIISQYLIQSSQNENMISEFFLLLKVVLVKFSYIHISTIWKIIFPEIFTNIIKTLEGSDDYEIIFQYLRMVEFLVVREYEEFYKVLCLLCADVPAIENNQNFIEYFVPRIIRRFIPDSVFTPLWTGEYYVEQPVQKTLNFVSNRIKSAEELDKHVKSFVQFCLYYSSSGTGCDEIALCREIEYDIMRLC